MPTAAIMIKCSTHKKVYMTQGQAEDALIDARSRFHYRNHQGPVAVYRCEDCGYYHLTSKGDINPRLAGDMAAGKIDLQKEANHWLDKFKKR